MWRVCIGFAMPATIALIYATSVWPNQSALGKQCAVFTNTRTAERKGVHRWTPLDGLQMADVLYTSLGGVQLRVTPPSKHLVLLAKGEGARTWSNMLFGDGQRVMVDPDAPVELWVEDTDGNTVTNTHLECSLVATEMWRLVLLAVGIGVVLLSPSTPRNAVVFYATGAAASSVVAISVLVMILLFKIRRIGKVLVPSVGAAWFFLKGGAWERTIHAYGVVEHKGDIMWTAVLAYMVSGIAIGVSALYIRGMPTNPRVWHVWEAAWFICGMVCIMISIPWIPVRVMYCLWVLAMYVAVHGCRCGPCATHKERRFMA